MDKRPLFYIIVIVFILFGWWALATGYEPICWAFLGAAAIITCIVSTVCVLDSRTGLFEAKAHYAQYLIGCDPQRLDMIDLNWPKLHLRMNGGASLTVDDSGCELSYFRKFLNASNSIYIVAQRTYNDKTIERAQWRLWQKYLLLEGAITEVRAQNETWKWSNPEEFYRWKLLYCDLKAPPELFSVKTEAPAGTQSMPNNNDITGQFD